MSACGAPGTSPARTAIRREDDNSIRRGLRRGEHGRRTPCLATGPGHPSVPTHPACRDRVPI